jgi:hypothetical protein
MFRLGLLALALTVTAAAQTVPGIPTYNRPLVSTPTVTLSNGFSPAVVTVTPTVVSEQPSAVGEMPQSDAVGPDTFSTAVGAMEVNTGDLANASSDYDYAGVNPDSAFSFTGGASLGDLARGNKNAHIEPHKTYTNQDIDQLKQSEPETGIISANFANGQPIVARNEGGFSPASGIANMPDVNANSDGTEMANSQQQTNPADQNPAGNDQSNATASNTDQGEPVPNPKPTMPFAQKDNQPSSNDQQMPASDNPR